MFAAIYVNEDINKLVFRNFVFFDTFRNKQTNNFLQFRMKKNVLYASMTIELYPTSCLIFDTWLNCVDAHGSKI